MDAYLYTTENICGRVLGKNVWKIRKINLKIIKIYRVLRKIQKMGDFHDICFPFPHDGARIGSLG